MSFTLATLDGQCARNKATLFRQEVYVLRRLFLIMLFGLVISTAGCGTLLERGEKSKIHSRSGHYYVGVQYDWRLLSFTSKGAYDYGSMLCYLSVVCPFVTLLSLPADFVVDTVMLYGDHQNKIVEERNYNEYLRSKYCLAEGVPDETALKSMGLDVGFCLVVRN